MSSSVPRNLSNLDRVTWVIDNAKTVDPENPGQQVAVLELLERCERTSKRGCPKRGGGVRLWLTLLLLCGYNGAVQIRGMHILATEGLPRDLQWQLQIINETNGRTHMLTERQLHRISQNIGKNLDPAKAGSEVERARRVQLLDAITRGLLDATLVVPRVGSSYVVDESGVWSWSKGHRRPTYDANPTFRDEDSPGDVRTTGHHGDRSADDASFEAPPADGEQQTAERDTNHRTGEDTFAAWGGKTHKQGGTSSYFGYGLHVLVRVADIHKNKGVWSVPDHPEPQLVEEFAVTPASTDIVEVTLDMLKRVIDKGQPIGDLLGDRHYSHKRYDRWALPLNQLGIKQVLDLRSDDHGEKDEQGAIIIAGTPHCPALPHGLRRLAQPGSSADEALSKQYQHDIAHRSQYAMRRHQTAQQNRDGKTRWQCPAADGRIACPRLAASREVAAATGEPLIDLTDVPMTTWCPQTPDLKPPVKTIPATPAMKHQQELYYGSPEWQFSYNRRTRVEGVFGNLRNGSGSSIKRGFTRLVGQPLVTLALAAATVAYNLKELEDWHDRALKADPTHTLAHQYAQHPLHGTTPHTYGFRMLTEDESKELDRVMALAVKNQAA